MSHPSLLPIILACDNVPPISTLPVLPFFLSSSSTTPIGHLPLKVWDAIASFTSSTAPSSSPGPLFSFSSSPSPRIFFSSWCDSVEKRTVALAELAESLRQSGVFRVPLDGWRNETYTIYGPTEECPGEESQRGNTFGRNVAFSLERAACGLFGVTSFGVHVTGYIEGPPEDPTAIRVWTPRRSKTKQTYPSMLDQTVAGGLTHGLSPLTCVVKECGEEASIPEELVLAPGRLTATGAITYVATAEGGWIQPEVQFCYDLKLPNPEIFKPTPDDGEAEYFELMTVPEIITNLHASTFKPNCALVMIDFLIRHSFITPESDPSYLEIVRRLRRDLGLPGIVGWGTA